MTDDKQREDFERWANLHNFDIRRFSKNGWYIDDKTQFMYWSWQAAIRHMREQELANRNAAEPLCVKCGNPTMHIGNVCYACIHSEQEDKA